jgi:hypothetical protein
MRNRVILNVGSSKCNPMKFSQKCIFWFPKLINWSNLAERYWCQGYVRRPAITIPLLYPWLHIARSRSTEYTVHRGAINCFLFIHIYRESGSFLSKAPSQLECSTPPGRRVKLWKRAVDHGQIECPAAGRYSILYKDFYTFLSLCPSVIVAYK